MVLFDEQQMYSYKEVNCQGADPSMSRRCNMNVVAIPTFHSHFVIDIASHFQRPFLAPWDSSEDRAQLIVWIASATGEFTHLMYSSLAFALIYTHLSLLCIYVFLPIIIRKHQVSDNSKFLITYLALLLDAFSVPRSLSRNILFTHSLPL